jgi:hypothetical protein
VGFRYQGSGFRSLRFVAVVPCLGENQEPRDSLGVWVSGVVWAWMDWASTRKADTRLPGKGDSHPHGARPVHQIMSMITWIRACKLSTHNSLWASGFGLGLFRVSGVTCLVEDR